MAATEGIEKEFLRFAECHDVDGLRKVLGAGFDPRAPVRGRTPVTWLTEMYSRSNHFSELLQVLLEAGGELDDPVLTPVLLNDGDALANAIRSEPTLLQHKVTMSCAFSPLAGASLLHVAAEYQTLDAARVLIEMGADLDAQTDVDEHGLNGQTPLFHTVNTYQNRGEPLLEMLLDSGARTDVRLSGITWGKGFEWETTFFDVTPLSYAQAGLYPQMHRREQDVYSIVKRLLRAEAREFPPLDNIPNKYLADG